MINKTTNLKKEGLKGAFWNFSSTVIVQLRGLIVSIILARLLDPNAFGIIAIALVFNGIIETLIDFGFSNAVVQKKEVTQVEKSTIFYINLILGLFFTIVIFLCGPLMSYFFEIPELKNVVRVTSLSFIIASFSTLQTSLFQRELDFKTPFKARTISSIISGIIGIILAFCGFGVWALVSSNLSSFVVNTILIWFYSSWRPTLNFNLRSVKSLWEYGWKMTVTTLFNRIFTQIDTFAIGKLFSAASLGLYNRAQSLNRLVVDYSFSSIRGVLLPTFSKLQDDINAFRVSALKLIKVICFLNFLFSGIMYVCASDLIIFLYGDKWIHAIPIFKILSIFSLHLSIPVLYDTIMSALARMNMYLFINIARKPIVLLSIPVGVIYGFYAYIWSINILYIISLLPLFWAVKKCIDLKYVEHFWAIFQYIIPFTLVIFVFPFIKINTSLSIINLVSNGFIYFFLYVGYCYITNNEGYKVCENIILNIYKKLKTKITI